MSSVDIPEFDENDAPPRPTTPPVRRGFVIAFLWLSVLAVLVYGIPYVADQTGYAWETGRSRAASEALAKLDKAGVIDRSSALFRMANAAVAPAVVNIRTMRAERAVRGERGGRSFIPQVTGLGSGVVIDKANGYIVTNNHVIKDAQSIVVRVGGRREIEATLVGADPKTDLAVLRIPGPLRAEAQWGDSDKLDIGTWVMAIGSPFALDHTVTAGIVSATGRNNVALPDMGEDGYQNFIQTDAAINPGNSGGPLIDLTGKVVGINTAIYSESGGYQGIGLAIPASMAKKIVDQLISTGKVSRGYLGISIRDISAAEAKKFNFKEPQGAMVVKIQRGGPADDAGLHEADVIVKLGDTEIADVSTLRNTTASLPLGSKVELTYYRFGKTLTTTVTIGELPTIDVLAFFGFELRELGSSETGKEPKKAEPIEANLVVDKVTPGGAADRAGLHPGMLVFAVGFRPVRTKLEFVEAAARINPLLQGLFLQIRLPDGSPTGIIIPPPRVEKH